LGLAVVQLAILPQISLGRAGASAASANSVVGADADQLGTSWSPNAGISPAQVNANDFGQLYDVTLPPVVVNGADVAPGEIYAQPVVADGVLLVVTEADNAYGLNPATGAVEWSENFGAPFQATTINCGDLVPTVGVTGTPVVDTSTGIAYFATDTTPQPPATGQALWQMQAVNIATGAEVVNFPVAIQGAAANAPSKAFDPVYQMQRPGLALVNGEVYAAFGSHCDESTWYGWIAGVSTAGALSIWVDVTGASGLGAGIWGPGGLVVDSSGNLYFATGNGDTPAAGPGLGVPQPEGLGGCVVKLSTATSTPQLADYFCPSDAANLNSYDVDLGSGSPTGLPASFGTAQEPDLLVQVGKSGEVYLLDRDNLGGVDQGPGGTDNVVSETGPRGGAWSHPAVWPGDGGYVYITTGSPGANSGGSSGELDIYQRVVTSGAVSLNWVGDVLSMPFGTGAPIVTSSGTQSGSAVVWDIVRTNGSGNAATLVAYGAVPVAGSDSNPTATLPVLWSGSVGNSTKFSAPLAYDSRIFVANYDGEVLAYGPLSVAPPLAGAAVNEPDTILGSASGANAVFTASGPVTVTGVSISVSTTGASGAFTTPAITVPVSLVNGQDITLPVTFDPKVVGGQQGTLTLTTDLGSVSIPLTGRGLPEGDPIAATPPSLNFGLQAIGGGTVQDTVSFENTSASPLTVDSVALASGAPAPFSVGTVPNPLPTIAPGGSISVPIDFRPPATSGDFVQTFDDQLVIATSAGEAVVPLAGSAAPPPQITISSLKLNIGTVAIGQSGIVSFTVGNGGGIPLTITKSKPPISDGFSADTSLSEGSVIAAHQTRVETVRFTPSRAGHVSTTWVINGNDTTGVQTVTVTATGAVRHLVPSPDKPGWQLSGRAMLTNRDLQLTSATRVSAGAAFWSKPIPTDGMRASFTAEMSGGSGGDGLTFALVDASTVPTRPGRTGARLGFAGLSGLAVALQSFPGLESPGDSSVGVVTSELGAKGLVWRKIVNMGSPLRNVHVKVTVSVSGGILNVAVDGFTVLTVNVTLQQQVYVGFTAATGSHTDRHLVSGVQIAY
jgi:hypothetical protein